MMSEAVEVASELPKRPNRSLHRYRHHPGVFKTSWGNTWFVQFQLKGERIYLGTFPTEAEAVDAKQRFLMALLP